MKLFKLNIAMNVRRGLILSALALCAVPGWAQKTIYVTTNGNDGRSGEGDWTNAVVTISNAVSKAVPTDTVLVSNGTYTVTTQINIAQAITVSAWPTADAPAGVVITTLYPDTAYSTRCVNVNSAGAVFTGFTVEKGYPNDNSGKAGGIWLQAGLVSNCVVRNCIATYGGGGIWAGDNSKVVDCTVSNNRNLVGNYNSSGGGLHIGNEVELLRTWVVTNYDAAASSYNAGGVYVHGINSRIIDCHILGNQNTNGSGGGGIQLYGAGYHLIDACIISNNYGKIHAGGIYSSGKGTNTISNSTITHNRTGNAGGGILAIGNSMLTISNCVITCNQSGYGAGVANNGKTASRGTLKVTHSRIVSNTCSGHGAGAYLVDNNGFFAYSVIASNVASGVSRLGAGLYIGTLGDTNALMTITNCLIMANKANGASSSGGGIWIGTTTTSVTLASCTIASNEANLGGGIFVSNSVAEGKLQVWNTVVASNISVLGGGQPDLHLLAAYLTNAFYYSCSPTLTNVAQGNITNAPIFTDGDYRLYRHSPGVNAGTNQAWMTGAVDLDGYPRIDNFNRRVDMGAYEYLFTGMMFSFY